MKNKGSLFGDTKNRKNNFVDEVWMMNKMLLEINKRSNVMPISWTDRKQI
jgi:hypothetical protein